MRRSVRSAARPRPRVVAAGATLLLVVLLHALLLRAIGSEPPARRDRAAPLAVQLRSLPPGIVRPAQAPTAARAEPAVVARPAQAQRTLAGRGTTPPRRLERLPGAPPRTQSPAAERSPLAASPPAVPAQIAPAPVAAPLGSALEPYPTRVPPPTTLQFALRRGAEHGRAELQWQHDDERYAARLHGELDGAPLLRWSSDGGFDSSGVAPERFVARGRRAALAVNFERDAGTIRFSGPSIEQPLAAGAQDRLSWMVQLAAIAQARTPVAGEAIVIPVAGPRGDAEPWRFEVLGEVAIDTAAGSVQALHLKREPRRRYDTRIEVWLDPLQHHLPVRALLANQDDGRDPLELLRIP